MEVRAQALRTGIMGAVVVSVTWLWEQSASGPTVLLDGETQTSSSGRYTSEFLAEEINGRRNVYPVIRNSASEVLWSDDRRYLMSAHPVGMAWQRDADVLWLLLNDTGTSRVMKRDGE